METACFETKLGWITVKKNRGNVIHLALVKQKKQLTFLLFFCTKKMLTTIV